MFFNNVHVCGHVPVACENISVWCKLFNCPFVWRREPSAAERQYYADLCAKIEVAQKWLGHAYGVLVMGMGLEEQHHMACGM